MGRFETEFLTQEDNRQALARMKPVGWNGRWPTPYTSELSWIWIAGTVSRRAQPITATSNGFGDCEGAKLRPGSTGPMIGKKSSIRWWRLQAVRLLFRADAGQATSIWRLEDRPSGCQQTNTEEDSDDYSLPQSPSSRITISLTRPRAGMYPEGWWPRWSGTREVSQSGLRLSNYRDSPLLQRPRHGGNIKEGKYALNWTRVLPQVRGPVRLGLFIILGQLLEKSILVADQSDQDDQDRRTVGAPWRLVFQLA